MQVAAHKSWTGPVTFCAVGLVLFGRLSAFEAPESFFSWALVLGEAHRLGLIFGRDIIYTGGPLSPLYTGYFQKEVFFWVAGFQVAVTAVAAVICANFARRAGLTIVPPLVLVFLFLQADVLFLLPSLLIVMLVSTDRESSGRRLLKIACAITAAGLSLAKFTTAPFALVCFCVVDLLDLSRRRAPLALGSYILAMPAIYMAIEGDLTWFIPFLRYSWDAALGYTSAMGINGPIEELLLYLIATAMTSLIIFKFELSLLQHRVSDLKQSATVLIPLGLFLFVTFKLGFVRHDCHT